jgi:hypothetical protein
MYIIMQPQEYGILMLLLKEKQLAVSTINIAVYVW